MSRMTWAMIYLSLPCSCDDRHVSPRPAFTDEMRPHKHFPGLALTHNLLNFLLQVPVITGVSYRVQLMEVLSVTVIN
jgi:hypothetical protein